MFTGDVLLNGISLGVNSYMEGLGKILPGLLLMGLSILVVLVFWREIRVFFKAVITGRSRNSIREDMFIDDWYDKWSNSEEGKLTLAKENVFYKELRTPGMQDKWFYTETIYKGRHFEKMAMDSDDKYELGDDLKRHKKN